MKIPLPELGLDCEKKEIPSGNVDTDHRHSGYNHRTAENEKSVLVIDVSKMVKVLVANRYLSKDQFDFRYVCNHLSQNAKSFMRIEKGE